MLLGQSHHPIMWFSMWMGVLVSTRDRPALEVLFEMPLEFSSKGIMVMWESLNILLTEIHALYHSLHLCWDNGFRQFVERNEVMMIKEYLQCDWDCKLLYT
ncbi:hypothetical protein CR513_53997, partial [Mucuna pruriens]